MSSPEVAEPETLSRMSLGSPLARSLTSTEQFVLNVLSVEREHRRDGFDVPAVRVYRPIDKAIHLCLLCVTGERINRLFFIHLAVERHISQKVRKHRSNAVIWRDPECALTTLKIFNVFLKLSSRH